MMNNIVMTASNILISEAKSSRRYMDLSMRMFSTRENLNHVAVTEAFIDNLIANKEDYVCMPLVADVAKLKKRDYRGLTHLYDSKSGTFLADVIGGFYDFEKVSDEYGISLIGHARVNKRTAAVCEAIEELYANNALSFSFEISAGALQENDGVTIVDASDQNELTAMAVVSVPAYPESKALDLVAEAKPSVDEFYSETKFVSAELDIETVRMWFYEGLEAMIGEESWHMRPLLFGVDFVLLYDVCCGGTYKAEYLVDGDALIMKDFYEVAFMRAEEQGSENEMNEEMTQQAEVVETEIQQEVETEVHAEATVDEETVQTEEVQEQETVEAAAETDETEPEQETAEEQTAEALPLKDDDLDEEEDEDDELEMAKKRCAELEAEIEELKGFKAELEQIRAEEAAQKIQAQKNELRDFAIAEGLNPEDEVIAQFIENMDHASLMSEAMKNKNAHKDNSSTVSFVASFNMRQGGTSYLLGHSK